jgi:hypothetical protein
MHHLLLEKHLAEAERHVRLGLAHLERQRALVDDYETLGRDARLARELLGIFEEMQVGHVSHRDRLIHELPSVPSHQTECPLIDVRQKLVRAVNPTAHASEGDEIDRPLHDAPPTVPGTSEARMSDLVAEGSPSERPRAADLASEG